MKKKIILFVISFIVLLCSIYTIYTFVFKEELVNVDLKLEIYSEHKLSDFKDDFECNLKDDDNIDTSKLGIQQIKKHCKNDDNKKIKLIINIDVVDTTKPLIILKDSFTVTEGYNKNLTDVIISVDNYDSKPKREIVGEYDFNTVGSYDLIYKVTDNSGNIVEKEFTLNVLKKQTSNQNNTNNSYIDFQDIVLEHKNDKTEIGIDVSKWQGEIDFKKVKEAGCEFVIMRIGVQDGFGGEYIIDPYFEQNIKNATSNGLKVGVYFYSYAVSIDDAKKQANWIIDTLGDNKLQLPIVYDWEVWSNFNSLNLSLFEFNKVADTFLNEIENHNYEAMLYSSKNYLENIWDNQNYKTWLAHYTKKTNYTGEYYIWQLCSDGKIDGIKGYVDIDVLYK